MATSFSRTYRFLGRDDFRVVFATGALAVVLLGAWAAWLGWGCITLYEVSEHARLEVASDVYPIQSPIAGRVTKVRLAIGRRVQAGDILVELDGESQQLQIREGQARIVALEAEVVALRAQSGSEERARSEERQSARLAADQARAHEREVLAPAQFSQGEVTRLSELRARGLIAERDYALGKAEAEKQQAALESSRTGVSKTEQDQRMRDRERDTRLTRLYADITHLEGEAQTIRAAIERLKYEAERRIIRAPWSGRLGEARTLAPGTVVAEGERLAAIVPDDQLRIVAQFAPSTAMGRLRPGQPARMRMHGYPWAQHGTLEATVARVADEIRDGAVRVELDVRRASARIPLQHGMPGNLEVETETISPVSLLLRLAGQSLMQPRDKQ